MRKNVIYELFICILSVISVVFAIIDIASGLPQHLIIVDRIIYCIFVTDYLIRFIKDNEKKYFFKHNIIDLVAIIPFNSAFRALRITKSFRVFRLAKLSKLAKLSRLASVSGRLLSKSKRFLNTNGFKYMLISAGVLILVGGSLITYFEKMSFADGIWWAFVTTTTVGYGDISPSSSAGRIIACILMLVGIGLIGSLTSTITTFFMRTPNTLPDINDDKIQMVKILYDELSDDEKDAFKKSSNRFSLSDSFLSDTPFHIWIGKLLFISVYYSCATKVR